MKQWIFFKCWGKQVKWKRRTRKEEKAELKKPSLFCCLWQSWSFCCLAHDKWVEVETWMGEKEAKASSTSCSWRERKFFFSLFPIYNFAMENFFREKRAAWVEKWFIFASFCFLFFFWWIKSHERVTEQSRKTKSFLENLDMLEGGSEKLDKANDIERRKTLSASPLIVNRSHFFRRIDCKGLEIAKQRKDPLVVFRISSSPALISNLQIGQSIV